MGFGWRPPPAAAAGRHRRGDRTPRACGPRCRTRSAARRPPATAPRWRGACNCSPGPARLGRGRWGGQSDPPASPPCPNSPPFPRFPGTSRVVHGHRLVVGAGDEHVGAVREAQHGRFLPGGIGEGSAGPPTPAGRPQRPPGPYLISPNCCPSAARSQSLTVLSQEPEHTRLSRAAKHQTQPWGRGGYPEALPEPEPTAGPPQRGILGVGAASDPHLVGAAAARAQRLDQNLPGGTPAQLPQVPKVHVAVAAPRDAQGPPLRMGRGHG